MKNKRIKIAGSFLVLAGLSLQLIYSPILAENNAVGSQPSSVSVANSTTEFKQGKSYALINDVNNEGETQVLFGDTDNEASKNKDKKSVRIRRHIAADGKSVFWRIKFNGGAELWQFGSLLSLILPDGLEDPETIDRYVEQPQHKIGIKDRIDVKKHWDKNITGRWKIEEDNPNFDQEFGYLIGDSSGHNYHHLKKLKGEKKFSKIFVDREWKSQKTYVWEFTTKVKEGYKAEDLFVGAGIRQGNNGFPRSSFVGPFDTDGDETLTMLRIKMVQTQQQTNESSRN